MLTLAAGATDSLGLLILVPLLQLVGAGPISSAASVARQAFGSVGVSHTLANVLLLYVVLIGIRGALVRACTSRTAPATPCTAW